MGAYTFDRHAHYMLQHARAPKPGPEETRWLLYRDEAAVTEDVWTEPSWDAWLQAKALEAATAAWPEGAEVVEADQSRKLKVRAWEDRGRPISWHSSNGGIRVECAPVSREVARIIGYPSSLVATAAPPPAQQYISQRCISDWLSLHLPCLS